MKKISLILILIFIALNISVAYKDNTTEPLEQKAKENEVKDWEDPAMIGRNKEPAHRKLGTAGLWHPGLYKYRLSFSS